MSFSFKKCPASAEGEKIKTHENALQSLRKRNDCVEELGIRKSLQCGLAIQMQFVVTIFTQIFGHFSSYTTHKPRKTTKMHANSRELHRISFASHPQAILRKCDRVSEASVFNLAKIQVGNTCNCGGIEEF